MRSGGAFRAAPSGLAGFLRSDVIPAAIKTVADRISHLEPCSEAKEWAKAYSSPSKAWKNCQRGDWMLWLIGKQSGEPESDSRKLLVLCSCECARLALPHTKDPRVLACIETAEKWARGEATLKELKEARKAAAAAYASYADAADSAAYASYSADAAARAADSAAYASYAASYAAYAADRTKVLAECADIVRNHYPKTPKMKSS